MFAFKLFINDDFDYYLQLDSCGETISEVSDSISHIDNVGLGLVEHNLPITGYRIDHIHNYMDKYQNFHPIRFQAHSITEAKHFVKTYIKTLQPENKVRDNGKHVQSV